MMTLKTPIKDAANRVLQDLLLPILSILAALIVGGLLLVVTGYDAPQALASLWQGVFGNTRNIGEAFLLATPLLLIGTGIAIAFRCGIWNIGADGQFYMGAVGGTFVGLHIANLPPVVAVSLALLAGFVLGGAWASIAAWLKVRLKLNEVVTTIMLNYIAIGVVNFLITGPMQEASHASPQTDEIAVSAILPKIFLPTRVHLGCILAVLFAIIMAFILFRTPLGYALRAVGYNQEAARHAGIKVELMFMVAMILSGGAAGLAGAIEVMGVTSRLYSNLSSGYGYTGIAVALLAGNNPLGTIITGWLFGALTSGSEMMQLIAKVPAVLISIIQGLVIAFLVSFRILGNRLSQKK
jgi:ABC-type uncharacterized transport system permease subunit